MVETSKSQTENFPVIRVYGWNIHLSYPQTYPKMKKKVEAAFKKNFKKVLFCRRGEGRGKKRKNISLDGFSEGVAKDRKLTSLTVCSQIRWQIETNANYTFWVRAVEQIRQKNARRVFEQTPKIWFWSEKERWGKWRLTALGSIDEGASKGPNLYLFQSFGLLERR